MTKTITLIDIPTYHNQKASKLELELLNLRIRYVAELEKSRQKTPSNQQNLSYSPGILSIAAYLRDNDINVNYISYPDLKANRISESDLYSAIENSHFIGVNAYTPTIDLANKICTLAKQIKPSVITLAGGSHVTALDIETLQTYPNIDLIIRGEGEETLLELIKKDGNPLNILGLTYRHHKKIIQNQLRSPLNLERLPMPAYDLLPMSLNKYMINLLTQRGCVYECSFCAEGRSFTKKRHNPLEKTIAELTYLNKYMAPNSTVFIADSIFISNLNKANAICEAIIKQKIHLKFICNLESTFVTPNIIEKMVASHFFRFYVAFESSNSSVLKTIQRNRPGASFSTNLKTCRLIRRLSNAFINTNWIIGLPNSTRQTLTEDIDAIETLILDGLIDQAVIKPMVPYPGTKVFDQAKELGITILSKHWADYDRISFPVFRLKHLNEYQIYSYLLLAISTAINAYCTRNSLNLEELQQANSIPIQNYIYHNYLADNNQ